MSSCIGFMDYKIVHDVSFVLCVNAAKIKKVQGKISCTAIFASSPLISSIETLIMKKFLLIAFLFIATIGSSTFAQDHFKQALDDFHHTLAFTYHPMIDDSNFTPIRSRSHELAQKAEALEKSFESEKNHKRNLTK